MPAPPDPPPPPWRQQPRPLAMDPGPARLEACVEQARAALLDEDPEHSELERRARRHAAGLQLEAEIRALAGRVGGGLPLAREAVLVCAQVLEAGAEPERAGRLLLEAGMPDRAALVAERAGDLELLQVALAEAHEPSRKAQEAAMAFAGYETALARGHLTEAAVALERARQARPDNPVYGELRGALAARCPPPPRLVLLGPQGTLTLALSPAAVGRAEDCGVRLLLPALSRRAGRVVVTGGAAVLEDAAGRVLWRSGAGAGRVDLGKAAVDVRLAGAGVALEVPGVAGQALVAAAEEPLELAGARVGLRWPPGGFPRLLALGARLRVGGEDVLAGGRDLALGDRVELGTAVFTVAR